MSAGNCTVCLYYCLLFHYDKSCETWDGTWKRGVERLYPSPASLIKSILLRSSSHSGLIRSTDANSRISKFLVAFGFHIRRYRSAATFSLSLRLSRTERETSLKKILRFSCTSSCRIRSRVSLVLFTPIDRSIRSCDTNFS